MVHSSQQMTAFRLVWSLMVLIAKILQASLEFIPGLLTIWTGSRISLGLATAAITTIIITITITTITQVEVITVITIQIMREEPILKIHHDRMREEPKLTLHHVQTTDRLYKEQQPRQHSRQHLKDSPGQSLVEDKI